MVRALAIVSLWLAGSTSVWAQSTPTPPSAPGSHLVVVDTIAGIPRPDGTLSDLDVYHPIDVSQSWPVVFFVHGWTAKPSTYQTLIEDLAARGFAVAAFRQVMPFELDLARWYQGAQTSLAALTHAGRDPSSPLFGLLDFDRLVTMGHSYGGSTSLLLAATDPRVKVAVALAPGCQPFSRPLLMRMVNQVRVPTLIVGAEFDFVVPVRDYARPMADQLPAAETLYVELAAAEHLCVTERNLVYYMYSLRLRRWIRTMPASLARVVSRNYANAWIEHHLGIRADTQGFVDGTQAAADEAAGILSRYRR